MNRPELFFVVARAANGVIGAKGRLPWSLPADLAHFKRLTMGHPMIMGRATFDSLPGILPGRRHIVLTRDPAWPQPEDEEVTVAHDLNGAIACANAARIAVIGGAQLFAEALPRVSRIELTEIHRDYPGDTMMPPFDDDDWQEVAREDRPAEGSRPGFSFVTLKRRP